MRHLGDHAANGRRIRTLDHLIQARESESLDNFFMRHRSADGGTNVLQFQLAAAFRGFLGSHQSSSAALPRRPATASLFFSFLSASKVALITLCGLVVPIDLVRT